MKPWRLTLLVGMAWLTALPLAAAGFDRAFDGGGEAGMRLYVRGTQKIQDGDHAGAVEDLRQAVRLRPDLAEAFHNLGFASERVGDPTTAIKAYERALTIKPIYPSAWNNLGYLLASLGRDSERAIQLCRRAVDAEPRNETFRDSLGWALYKADRRDDALAQFRIAVKLNPSYAKAQFNLGLCELAMKHWQEAAGHFEKAVRLEPGFTKAYVSLATCYERLNLTNKALYVYQSALTRIADNDPARTHIEREVRRLSKDSKQAYFSTMKKQLAGQSKLEAFIDRKGRKTRLAGAASPTASRRIDPTIGGGSFTPVSAVMAASDGLGASGPDLAAAWSPAPAAGNLGDLVGGDAGIAPVTAPRSNPVMRPSGGGTRGGAPSRARAGDRLSTDDERLLQQKYSLAYSYFERGLVREAAGELKTIADLAPDSSSVGRQARSMLLKVQQRLDQDLRRKADTHLTMGKDFVRSGKFDLAEAELRKALELTPNSAEAYKDLALLHYNTGRLPEAMDEAKRAIALDKGLKEAYVVLASLYAKKGRDQEAIQLLKRVRSLPGARNAVDELADRMLDGLTRQG